MPRSTRQSREIAQAAQTSVCREFQEAIKFRCRTCSATKATAAPTANCINVSAQLRRIPTASQRRKSVSCTVPYKTYETKTPADNFAKRKCPFRAFITRNVNPYSGTVTGTSRTSIEWPARSDALCTNKRTIQRDGPGPAAAEACIQYNIPNRQKKGAKEKELVLATRPNSHEGLPLTKSQPRKTRAPRSVRSTLAAGWERRPEACGSKPRF